MKRLKEDVLPTEHGKSIQLGVLGLPECGPMYSGAAATCDARRSPRSSFEGGFLLSQKGPIQATHSAQQKQVRVKTSLSHLELSIFFPRKNMEKNNACLSWVVGDILDIRARRFRARRDSSA